MAGNFTPGEDISDLSRWQPKSLESPAQEQVKLPTAQEIERIHQDAHREGYEAGHKEGFGAGYQAGQAKARQEYERFRVLADTLGDALKNLEHELSQDVLALSLDIAKQVLRQALKVKPELLIPVVKSAMESLPQNVQHPHIHLHPDDAELVRAAMNGELSHVGWRIVEDARVARGGCLIETASAEVDASIPSRWRRIATLLGQDHSWLDDAD